MALFVGRGYVVALTAVAWLVGAAVLLERPAPAGAACELGGVPGTPYAGAGSAATGGADRPVVHVTTLADNQDDAAPTPGSLRAAVGGNRCIVFDVGGTITLTTRIRFANVQDMTIDGFTAPAPGITLRAAPGNYGYLLMLDRVRNGIVRGLKLDCGYANNGLPDGSGLQGCVNLAVGTSGGFGSTTLVIDHNSFRRAGNDTVYVGGGASGTARDITISNNIVQDPWAGHPTCMLFYRAIENVSVHHNLFGTGCRRRSPWVTPYESPGGPVDVRNNLMWNVGGSGTSMGSMFGYEGHGNGNVVANYYKASPECDEDVDCQKRLIVVCRASGSPFPEDPVSQCAKGDAGATYVSGNVTAHGAAITDAVNAKGSVASAQVVTPALEGTDACTAAAAITGSSGAGARGPAFALDEIDQALLASIPPTLRGCEGASPSAVTAVTVR